MGRFLPAVIVIAFVMSGCETPPSGSAPAPGATDGEFVRWPYRPASMRFHPLTRSADDPARDGAIIEARIEFSDRDGVTARGYGQLAIEFVASASRNPLAPDQNWDIELRDLDANATHFDEVTRTYLFKLEIEGATMPSGILTARYLGAAEGSRELSARYELR
jgi:hypothetical protein